MPEQPQTPMRKSAMVGVVGRTNAGKSTVVNQMVGEKVSIVSPVEQTTRNTIRGIVDDLRGQLVLLDTPGLHKAVGPLGKLLQPFGDLGFEACLLVLQGRDLLIFLREGSGHAFFGSKQILQLGDNQIGRSLLALSQCKHSLTIELV